MTRDEKMKEIEERIKQRNKYVEKMLVEQDREYLFSECERLEGNIPDPQWCCAEHKAKLVARIKELEKGIEKWLRGDGEEDDCTYFKKLIEKEK